MNLLNRLLLIVLMLAFATLAIAIIILAWTIPNDSIAWLRDAVQWMDDNETDTNKLILSAVLGIIALLCLIVLVIELIPRSPTEVKVTDLRVGDAVLSTAAIGQRVEEAVSQVPHVADARATIKAKKRGVIVSLDLHVDPEANLATVTDEACQAASDVLTKRVHVALAEPPRARLHYRELRMGRNAPRPMTVREAPTPRPALPETSASRPVTEDRQTRPAEPVSTVESRESESKPPGSADVQTPARVEASPDADSTIVRTDAQDAVKKDPLSEAERDQMKRDEA